MTPADHATVRRDHAVVIGASVAGLLAARALSDAFSRVTVIDRDVLPDGPDPRSGVPQSRQLHILLARGAEVLDELFPGFSEEMTAAGVPRGDAQADLRTYLDGHLLRPAPSGIIVSGVSRPLIERMIRTRVTALPGIEIVDSTDVLGLVTDMDRRRVTGVRVRRRTDDAEESTIDADLVVDASGRGSRARVWLRELGYPQPPTSKVRPEVVYVTRHYRREPQHLNGHHGSTMVPFPGLPRGGGVLREEGGRFAVVLFGLIGEEPPLDDRGMKAYAETLSGPDAAEIIRSARPLDEPVKMRYPASVRHHYEKLDRHLNGFLITGDALCNFNPTYGQGMTVAALEALLLRGLLADGTGDLARRFFPAAAKVVDGAWFLAAGGDLRFPQIEGDRKAIDRLLGRYLDHYRAAASVDPVLGASFIRVANMLDPPTRLLSPGHVFRVFRSARKAVRASAARAKTTGNITPA